MRQSRITSNKSSTTILAEESFPLYTYLLKLWLSEPLHHPALRATFFPKKAFRCSASRIFYMPPLAASERKRAITT